MTEAVRRRSIFSPLLLVGWFLCLVLTATDQWLLGPSLFVLLIGWRIIPRKGEAPVVAAAFAFQWLQVTLALFYMAIIGRRITEMKIDYQPIVLVSLASIAAYFGGYLILRARRGDSDRTQQFVNDKLSLSFVALSYVATIGISALLLRIAWLFPAITQLLFVLSFTRYALLYLLVVRLLNPTARWGLVFLVLGAELAMGFGGYFASFKDSLIFIGLAIVVSRKPKRLMSWVALIAVVTVAFSAGLAWTAIKGAVRKEYSSTSNTTERLQRAMSVLIPAIEHPVVPWGEQVDHMVSRIWQVYYPALALKHVPAFVPHENGKILMGALSNTLKPRIFFPDKGILASESELVKKYAGVRVAGRESNTSIAFGYVAESYVDYGWPGLLVPIFLFGCVLGLADRLLPEFIRNPDLLQSVRVVVFWSAMASFEASWVFMIGTFVSLYVTLTLAAVAFERGFKLAAPRNSRISNQATFAVGS